MDIAVADLAPVTKLDAQLEYGLGLAYELSFIDAKIVVELLNVRQGGFANSDRADLSRFI